MDKKKIIIAIAALIVLIVSVVGFISATKSVDGKEEGISESASSVSQSTSENNVQAENNTKSEDEKDEPTSEKVDIPEAESPASVSDADRKHLEEMLTGIMDFANKKYSPEPLYFFYNFDQRKSEFRALEFLLDEARGTADRYSKLLNLGTISTEYKNTKQADPLNKYGDSNGNYSYKVYDGEKVDYLIKNVLNTELDHDYQIIIKEKVFEYYYQGKYYTPIDSYDIGKSEIRIESFTQNKDGQYVVEYTYLAGQKEASAMSYSKLTAEIKEMDGKRFWSIYRIETIRTLEK